MGELTKEEKQAVFDRTSPEAQAIDQKMVDAVNARTTGKKHPAPKVESTTPPKEKRQRGVRDIQTQGTKPASGC